MKPQFDLEKLRAHQAALRFVARGGPIIEQLPAKLTARDQLDRASTSIALHIAEGNGKRSHPDRGRHPAISRDSVVACAAGLDVLVAHKALAPEEAAEGRILLLGPVSRVSGLIARFSGQVAEDAAFHGSGLVEKENE